MKTGKMPDKALVHRKRAFTSKPPFTIGDLKKAIPPHCFHRSVLRSFSYLALDLIGITLLYYTASTFIVALPKTLQILAWPSYWLAQSCIMLGILLIGHECGHQSFSDHQWLNNTVGFILHSCLFIPYFSWKYSHASHHAHTGSIEKDEVFVPRQNPLRAWRYLDNPVGRIAYILGTLLFGHPLYLALNFSGRPYDKLASHYDPYSPIFSKSKRLYIVISDLGLLTIIYIVYTLTLTKGVMWMMFYYVVPLLLTNAWLVALTYLQHTHPSIPCYDSSAWDWLRGALSTVDRDLGVLNHFFHHATDCHVVHHLFPRMPHYHINEATNAIKPILGEYYQCDKTPVYRALYQVTKECVFVREDAKSKGVYWYRNLVDEILG